MAPERGDSAKQAVEPGLDGDPARGAVDGDMLRGGVDKLAISRRRLLVVMGCITAPAAVATATLGRGPSAARAHVTRGRGQWTSFGSVSLVGWSRHTLTQAGAHGGHHASSVPVPSAVHGAWTDAVVVDVEVHNGTQNPVELSPGQFRVRVDDDGPTVSLYRADRVPGAMAANTTATLRISYLAPPKQRALSLEFADAGAMTLLGLGRLEDGRSL
jgi:hypothetical protein